MLIHIYTYSPIILYMYMYLGISSEELKARRNEILSLNTFIILLHLFFV